MNYIIVDISNIFSSSRFVTSGDIVTKLGMTYQILFRSLKKINTIYKPDHFVFCFDTGSWRSKYYSNYKSLRKMNKLKQTDDEQEETEFFYGGMQLFKEFLEKNSKTTVLSEQFLEADDLIAGWIQNHPDDKHMILSSDSDFVQLLDDNVKIYDGIQDRILSSEGVIDKDGKIHKFEIKTSSGKIKTGEIDPLFIPEDQWWKLALFTKIIRGDSGDSIFTCYPGVSFKGSSKRAGIIQAWNDRENKGYDWNNFMLQEWIKKNIDGTEKKVRVIDEFKINEMLIDLSKQPEDVRDLINITIENAKKPKNVQMIGIKFLKFCGQQNLPALVNEAQEHAAYLSKGLHGL